MRSLKLCLPYVAIILLNAIATSWAQTTFSPVNTQPTSFQIRDSGKLVLEINMKGEVTFGEGVTPSEAAKRFAQELKKQWPKVCGLEPSNVKP